MKPARLIGILFMVTVLLGMVSIIGMGVLGFGRGMHKVFSDETSGLDIQSQHTDLQFTYKSLSVAGPIDLEWVRDAKTSFDVTGDASLVKKMKYETRDGSLVFKLKDSWMHSGTIKVTVHGPQPASIALAGSGDTTLHKLDKGHLELSVAGSGNVDLDGSLDEFVVNVAGSGDVDGLGLQCKTAEVTIAGSGNVDVDALSTLSASIMGSGNVGYKGNPKISKTIMGSGDIEKKD